MPADPSNPDRPRRLRPGPRRGLTLVEVMICVVIMGSMLAAALGAVGAAARTRVAQKESALGLSFARQLLSEVVQTRYQDLVSPVLGVETGETRATYDDVDDYNGLDEANAQYANGTVMTNGTGWRRQVAVALVSPTDPTQTSATDKGLKRVTVTVTSPTGRKTTLTALRSNYDGYENTPGAQATYTCWVGVSVQVGTSSAAKVTQGANLQNLVP